MTFESLLIGTQRQMIHSQVSYQTMLEFLLATIATADHGQEITPAYLLETIRAF